MEDKEIEQEFYKAFDIKPDCLYHFLIEGKGDPVTRTIVFHNKQCLTDFITISKGKGRVIKNGITPHIYYPEITDRRLLKLIVALNHYAPPVGDSIDEIRLQVMYWCTQYKSYIYDEVRKILGIKEAQ